MPFEACEIEQQQGVRALAAEDLSAKEIMPDVRDASVAPSLYITPVLTELRRPGAQASCEAHAHAEAQAPAEQLRAQQALCATLLQAVEALTSLVADGPQIAEVMGGVLETAVGAPVPVILSALRTVAVMVAVARRSAPDRSPCCVGDNFPQGLLLSLLPLVEDKSPTVCAATLRTLQSLVRAVPATALDTASAASDGDASQAAAVFSDSQASLLLGLVGRRAATGGLDGELTTELAATMRLVLTRCHHASATLLKAVPLAFHLHALALGE